MKIRLEDVYKKSGVPTHTFVKPQEYNTILQSLRTHGRCLVVEGPSGIGKTTCVEKVIEDLGMKDKVCMLSSRKAADRAIIDHLTNWTGNGIVIIDDFHILPQESKLAIANYMKVLADEERETDKLILLGINKAGDSLVELAPDLNNRIDTVKLERNKDDKVRQLIKLGESVLNIEIAAKEQIIKLSKGSFHIAQLLCNELCVNEDVLEAQDNCKVLGMDIDAILTKVIEEFSRIFYKQAHSFAVGSKLRSEGRAPYLRLLFWLSQSDDWTLRLDLIVRQHPEHKISINQIVDKGFLSRHINRNTELQKVIHYDTNSKVLTIEDPKFMFYLRNLDWEKFVTQLGYINVALEHDYDFALSFAGEERELAKRLTDLLETYQIAVFYDHNEQYRILSDNVEDYLAPIYESKARFIVPFLSINYPKKLWTKFESDHFQHRFKKHDVIPIWFSNCQLGIFDESRKYGGYTYKVDGNVEQQVKEIADTLRKCLREDKLNKERAKSLRARKNTARKKSVAAKTQKKSTVKRKPVKNTGKKKAPDKKTKTSNPQFVPGLLF
nr:TIR domain-containing protein [uncultured Chitinophaga sp.]